MRPDSQESADFWEDGGIEFSQLGTRMFGSRWKNTGMGDSTIFHRSHMLTTLCAGLIGNSGLSAARGDDRPYSVWTQQLRGTDPQVPGNRYRQSHRGVEGTDHRGGMCLLSRLSGGAAGVSVQPPVCTPSYRYAWEVCHADRFSKGLWSVLCLPISEQPPHPL